MTAPERSLELSREERAEMVAVATERVLDHLETLPEQDAADVDGEALDGRNRRVLDAVNRRNRVHLSGTRLDGRFTPCVSVLSFRTHREHVEHCVEDVARAVRDEVD
jgi:predicted ArsR family transcriptional regulator